MSEPLSLGNLARILLRHWIILIVLAAVGGVGGYFATRFMTPVFTATATQLVKGAPGTGAAANYEAAQYAVSRAKSYPSFVYSSPVLDGVRTDLGGAESLEDLRKDLIATNPTDTPLIRIAATASTPAQAQNKANSAARHLARFITQIETVNGKSPVTVETAVQAALPVDATSPKTLLIAGLGGLVGLVLATIIALARAYAGPSQRAAARRQAALGWAEVEVEPGSVEREVTEPVDPRPDTTTDDTDDRTREIEADEADEPSDRPPAPKPVRTGLTAVDVDDIAIDGDPTTRVDRGPVESSADDDGTQASVSNLRRRHRRSAR